MQNVFLFSKAPTAVTEEEKKEKTRFEKFMEECMAEANGVSTLQ